jgi:hypothetical protein
VDFSTKPKVVQWDAGEDEGGGNIIAAVFFVQQPRRFFVVSDVSVSGVGLYLVES